MFKPLLALFFLLVTGGGSPALGNASGLPPSASPSGLVAPAGEQIIFYDKQRLLVLDPADVAAAGWSPVSLPEGSAFDSWIECSADGKGFCAVTISKAGKRRLATFDVESRSLTQTSIELDEILAVESARKIYVSLGPSDAARRVYSIDSEKGGQVFIGLLSIGERFVIIPIDGVLTPAFVNNQNEIRFPGSDRLFPVRSGFANGRSTSSVGVFVVNDLFQKYEDGRDRSVVGLSNYSRNQNGQIERSFDGFEVLFPSSAMPLSYAIDSEGNAISIAADEDGLRLNSPCVVEEKNGQTRRASKLIESFPTLTQVQLEGSGRGSGIVLRTRQVGQVEKLNYVKFRGFAPDHFGGKDCSDLKLEIQPVPPLPNTSMPTGWKESVVSFTLSDGSQIAGILFQQENLATERLIIDVYGASGLLRNRLDVPNSFLNSYEMRGTAIYYPILPGDGNLGWSFAAASRAPNRDVAIRTLVELVRQVKSEKLPNGGTVYLRGASAGGWLAIKTALSEPGLVDEVISISGAYFFEEGDDVIELADFFQVHDSVSSKDMAQCGETFFRLIHGTADTTVPISRVMKFGSFISENECEGGLLAVEGGTHNLTNFSQFEVKPVIFDIMKWSHGIE